MADLIDLSVAQMGGLLRGGELSSRELTQAFIERIERLEPDIHAFLTLTPELALAQARRADQQLADWRRGANAPLPALLGIPLAVKDILCVAGVRCTCGSRILENFVPPYSATAVERLLADGAVLLGKTNTDEFAMGSSTENSAYGPTRNPWDRGRVPGGSSGGSAAAIAARMAPLALGTDTGGSVRQPASLCGVTGLKPTYGRVSRFGLVAFGSSLDVVGAFGVSAADIVPLFTCMAGHDPKDSTSLDLPVREISLDASAEQIFAGLRVGVPREYFRVDVEGAGIQPEVEAGVRRAIDWMGSCGAIIEEISLPHTEYALPVYYLIAPAEASANLARFDGVRYGLRVDADSLWEMFYKTRGQGFGPEVKRRIMLGTYALSAGYYEAYYGQAQKVRTLIKADFDTAFEKVDLIAAPVTPGTAFRFGEHSENPLAMYLQDVFTLPASLAGIPGISMPVGFDRQNLPIGMQLLAAPFQEERLLYAAHAYQQATDWHLRRPSLQ
jgi:aspartyl-tRNA(Asn)/glutamyl-tRNA(Gln) amidotransferase subunit A